MYVDDWLWGGIDQRHRVSDVAQRGGVSLARPAAIIALPPPDVAATGCD